MKLCEKCNRNTATISITQIINDEKTEMHLCTECAKIDAGMIMNIPLIMNGFLGGAFGNIIYKTVTSPNNIQKNKTAELTKQEKIKGLQKELQEAISKEEYEKAAVIRDKIKKIENGKSELEKLNEQLQEAISKEEYENAVIIRDKIKELQKAKTDNSK